MEFLTYEYMGERKDRHDIPRIGTLEVVEPLTQAHYLAPCPLDDIWGTAPKGSYPVYGKFDWLREGDVLHGVFLQSVVCSIPAVSDEGKPFSPSFQPYGYQLPHYLGDGAEVMGGRIRIRLDPPFRMTGHGLVGYDPAWAGAGKGEAL